MTSGVRNTSIMAYDEIQEKGTWSTNMQRVLDLIRHSPLMTAKEYAQLYFNTYQIPIELQDENEVKPRITDNKDAGFIISVGKRKCTVGGKLCYVWATLEGLEVSILRTLGFEEGENDLFKYIEEDITLFQDFRGGKRKSYAFDEVGRTVDHKSLDIYKKFKEQRERFIGGTSE